MDTTGETRGCIALAKDQKDMLSKHLLGGATVSDGEGDAGVEIGVYSFFALMRPARSEKLSR